MEGKESKDSAESEIRSDEQTEGRPPTEAVEAAPPDPLIAEREAQIEELQKELLYQRAEFENFRKRTEKRYRDALEFATEPLVKELLPVLDNLERAIDHSRDTGPEGLSALVEGLERVLEQFRQALAKHGVDGVQAAGEKFDPNIHESLGYVAGEEDNRVAHVYERGYLLKGRLLRPAKVAISKVARPSGNG